MIDVPRKSRRVASAGASSSRREAAACHHCGLSCIEAPAPTGDKVFCCRGCRTVFELLSENGLGQFYQIEGARGARATEAAPGQFQFLDEPAVRAKLVDFSDGKAARVRFSLPTIHCIACVWLLENLFKLHPGIASSRVNFPRKEVAISFDETTVTLGDLASLLASLGYPPELNLSDLERGPVHPAVRRLYLQIGVAGFAFGNTMLFALSGYFGLDTFHGPAFRSLFGWLSLALSMPVVVFSAADYWKSAWTGLKHRRLTLDVPIALGIAALFSQSVWDLVSGRGDGYFDSLAGLIFYLLLGKLFQQKTYDRLAFDRDYRSFFPLSVVRLKQPAPDIGHQASGIRRPIPDEERVALSQLRVGDHLLVRHGELVPADSRLVSGSGVIDYSFVTGEDVPVEKEPNALLYAGGRQAAGTIEVEMLKPVSQGYLTSLWNQDVFGKGRERSFSTLANRLAPAFTLAVLLLALGSAIHWGGADPSRAVRAFTAVLIVACPCALALAAPFALGSAQRVLARRGIFLRNPHVLETLARVDTVVFDKTGTLTSAKLGEVRFTGSDALNADEESWVSELASHSTHPLSAKLTAWLGNRSRQLEKTDRPAAASFAATPGNGIQGTVDGHSIVLGAEEWVRSPLGISSRPARVPRGSAVHVAIDGRYRGHFVISSNLRPEIQLLLADLGRRCEIALLSGDNERERGSFQTLFGDRAKLFFNQSPLNKLGFIRDLQEQCHRTVMMVGDGLNDAGALKQSDVGVAVVENVGAFSPASDIIMAATLVPRTHHLLRYARNSVKVVRASLVLSLLYNVVGVAFAASGRLSPVVCAILMPLSSITVVAFASGLTAWLGRRSGIGPDSSLSSVSPEKDNPTEEDTGKDTDHQPFSSAKAVQGRAMEVQSS
jgi:Cu+-exporting ATPase